MASGNQASVRRHDDDKTYNERQELERVKEYLQEVTVKNQHLEEMLLYTSQELEKEKENSRKIVQTLTERLMESREMINKLEVENMRYKKDCLLAVELLQCNRSVDQAYVTRTVRKLSDQMDPVSNQRSGNPFALDEHDQVNTDKPAKGEIKNVQETRPRATSKRKSKSEADSTNEDRTALLRKQEANEAQVEIFDQEDKTTKNNQPKDKQYTQTANKTGLGDLSSTTDSSYQKQSDNSTVIGGMNDTKGSLFKGEKECSNEEFQHEDKALIEKKQFGTTDSQVDLNSVQHKKTKGVDDCSINETEEGCIQEDKPLIVDETEPSTEQSLNAPRAKENRKSSEENPDAVAVYNCGKAEGKNTRNEINSDNRPGSVRSTTTVEKRNISMKETLEDQVNNEADKLLLGDAEESEENHPQPILPEASKATSEHETVSNEGDVTAFISDGGKASMDESSTKVENETNDDQVETLDDDTSTAEENTPLV